jgi:ElaB/YqjD/DUF883 family membrane-anchored ribosome-binding protein
MEMAMTNTPTTADQIGDAASRTAGRGNSGAHMAEEAFERGKEAFKKGLDQSKVKLSEAADMAASCVEDAHAFVTRQAREKPVQTTAIALGAGLLVGMFLAGRRR